MTGRAALVLWLTACGFNSRPAAVGDAPPPVDARIDTPPPVTCGDLRCDPNATCATTGVATCICKQGFTGDGMTCADIDECAMNDGGCPAACMNTTGTFVCYAPASCAEVKAHVPGAADNTYTMYLDGDAGKAWKGFCAGMAGTPHEYLSLTGMNFSQYTRGGASQGMDVKTTYTKVRFDPVALKIDISDRAFATSTGTLNHDSMTQVTSMPYAVAMDCITNNSTAGIAQIDLSTTAFALTGSGEFAQGGAKTGSGNVQLSGGNQRAMITGGGFCGWNAPVGAPTNPFNDNAAGTMLPVVYAP